MAEQALYWVDIEGKLLQRYTPATRRWSAGRCRSASAALRCAAAGSSSPSPRALPHDLVTSGIEWIARPDKNPRNR
jgi:hypothetical protein